MKTMLNCERPVPGGAGGGWKCIGLAALLFGLAAPSLFAARVVTAVTPRDVDYVLDADAGTARDYHLIKGTVTVQYGGPMVSRNTRVALSLIDDTGAAVPLVAGTNLTSTYNPGELSDFQIVIHDFDFALDPNQQLDPNRRYHVHAQVQQFIPASPPLLGRWWDDLGVSGDSAERQYFHFTNTSDSDPDYNVLATIEAVSLSRAWRMQTLTNDNRNFRATCDLRLVRYDQLGSLPGSSNVPFQLRLSLVDDGGKTIGLVEPASGIESFSVSMGTKAPRSTLPYDDSHPITISFRPGVQLDPINRSYRLAAELWSPPAPKAPYLQESANSSSSVKLLDYNGNLRFGTGSGAVTTVLTDAARTGGLVAFLPFPTPTYAQAELNIAELSLSSGGTVFTGSPGLLTVRLLSNGLATYNGSGTVTLTNPDNPFANQQLAHQGISYLIGPEVSLTSGGATGTVSARLPAGMGISTAAAGPGSQTFVSNLLSLGADVALSNQLAPLNPTTFDYSGGAWVVEESKPVSVRVSSLTLQPATGRIDLAPTGEVHHPETAMRQQLEAAPAGLPDREKRSNSDYWLLASAVNTAEPAFVRQSPRDPAAGSNAALNIEFEIGGGSFKSHFPEASVSVGAAGNPVKVEDDLVNPAESYLDTATLNVAYLAGDPDASPTACGGAGVVNRSVMLRPTTASARLQFTPTGGLKAPCTAVLTSGHALGWGYLGGSQYAFTTDAFQFIGFYMPGTFHPAGSLGTGDSESSIRETPVPMHLCGHVDGTWRFENMESPGSTEYRTNSLRADYAGINLRVANEAGGFQGHSIISAQDAGSYPLKTHCRYYARKSGVTGIHDADGGPTEASLYGFEAFFTSYGMAFRDCRVVESLTNGGLAVPYPSDFALELEEIRFTSTGRPLDARLPTGIGSLNLRYWNCSMFPTAVAFASTNPCDSSQGRMRIQAGVEMPNLGHTLYGELAFSSDGRIDHSNSGDSRLKAPNHVALRGPQRPADEGQPVEHETYTLTPVADVYLNNYDDYASQSPQGFLNLAGKLDVAFFEDLKVVVQTTAGIPGQEGAAPLHMMADWGGVFTDPEGFDPTNRGFPAGSSPEAYRSDPGYRPHARRTWLDAIEFDYPLEWSDATRSFRSPDDWDGDIDLLVLTAGHQLEYLSAEEARLRFGATYEGIPQIDLGGMLVNAVDEATGVLSVIEEALPDGAALALHAGSDAVAGLLNDSFDELFGPVLEQVLNHPLVPTPSGNVSIVEAQFLEPLGVPEGGLAVEGSLIPGEQARKDALRAGFEDPTYGLKKLMRDMATYAHGELPNGFVKEMTRAIDETIDMLDVFVAPDDDDQYPGLLSTDGGNYVLVGELVYELIDQLADDDLKKLLGIKEGGPAFDAINKQVTAYIEKHAPALATIRTRLEQLRTQLEDVRDALTSSNPLEGYIQQMFTSATAPDGEFDTMIDLLVDDMIAHLDSQYGGSPEAFADTANRQVTGAFLVRRVRNHLAAAGVAVGVQTLAREQLQDLQSAIDQTIGSTFSTVNRVIRDVIEEAAGALDDAVAPLNGALAEVAAAGSIDGYAVIRGDRLDHLRLDAKLELELDEPMTFQGFLEINQLQAGGPYGDAREIIVGAIDVPIELLNAEANFTINGRIILDNADNLPVSLGGSIEMTRGQLEFESFKITELGAAMQFGISDNYFAAKLGMEFESFRVAGGLFVGHSNTIEPLELVDPEVAELITAPITGVYAYGEAFMPIVDLGCMFRVSAGLGIGAFYFTEGPTYGGKIYAAVEGDALCVVNVRGEVTMIGVKSDIMRFRGSGRIKGRVGKCPFCVKFRKSVSFTYDENNGFDADY